MDYKPWGSGLLPEDVQVSCSPGDPAIIALGGELDTHTVVALEWVVTAILARHPRPRVIVMDLDEVGFLSVAGVRALHAATDRAAAHLVTFRVALGRRAIVRRALAVTGAEALLDIYPDRYAALDTGLRRVFDDLVRDL
ncbi:STAS domain-containing protein [Amycolatopsis sp. cmx-11-32]|uniref:STAS domain-containing protein n=1 Tax=Amycolatopsis sp. cmx-11-32 TaxID=2785796 RepID=UPI0039E33C10